MSFSIRKCKSDVEINLGLRLFGNRYKPGFVHDKYIHIPIGMNGDDHIYDVYQLCNGYLTKIEYKDKPKRNYYITDYKNTFYINDQNTGTIHEIYTADEYIETYDFRYFENYFYIVFNSNNILLTHYHDDVFETQKYTIDPKYIIASLFETQDNIYFARCDIYDKIRFSCLNKLSNIVTDLPIKYDYIFDIVTLINNRYYLVADTNKLTVINKKNQIKTCNFTYTVNDLYCNNNYIIIRDRNISCSNIHNMKLQLIRQINKSITHLSDKIIVFNDTKIYEIIPITHKIKKLMINCNYKHILRLFQNI